jgi:hypothetical protein
MTSAVEPEYLYMEFTTKRKSGRTWIITPDGSEPVFEMVKVDNTIFKALVKAHLWQRELDRGKYSSIRDLATKKNVHESYARRIINMNYLSPRIRELILDGTQPKYLKLQDIIYDVPLLWSKQEEKWLNQQQIL